MFPNPNTLCLHQGLAILTVLKLTKGQFTPAPVPWSAASVNNSPNAGCKCSALACTGWHVTVVRSDQVAMHALVLVGSSPISNEWDEVALHPDRMWIAHDYTGRSFENHGVNQPLSKQIPRFVLWLTAWNSFRWQVKPVLVNAAKSYIESILSLISWTLWHLFVALIGLYVYNCTLPLYWECCYSRTSRWSNSRSELWSLLSDQASHKTQQMIYIDHWSIQARQVQSSQGTSAY